MYNRDSVLSFEDVPSPEVTEIQARSFCVRALRGAARKLGGGDDWEQVEASWAVDDSTSPDYGFNFRAICEDPDEEDSELLPETYAVDIMHHEPVFALSEQAMVYFDADEFETDEDQLFDEPFDEGEDDEWQSAVGYMLVTETIFFTIFQRGSGCDVTKGLRYDFYTEDEDHVASELGYRSGALLDEVENEYLESLFQDGESLLDTQKREREQSTVTVSDLEVILGHLKRGGLAGNNMRAVLKQS